MQGKNCEQDFGRLFAYVSEVSHNLGASVRWLSYQ